MIAFLVGLLTGIATSYAANILWSFSGDKTVRRLRAVVFRRRRHAAAPTGMLTIGTNLIPWVVCATGPWRRENIRCHYKANPSKRHPVVEKPYAELAAGFEKRAKRGETVPFNGLGYQLESFDVSERTVPDEEPVLRLRFRPTDYYHMLVTDQRLDDPLVINGQNTTLRQEFASRVDLSVRPVPEFATHFGIALMVVTADGQTFFSERGRTAVDAFAFFPSVAEGASRPVDQDQTGAPDPYRTGIRGAAEELGIEINPEQIEWLSFGANAVLCEYGLIGLAHVELTANQILEMRSLGVPKDRWENNALHAVRFDPASVAKFVNDHRPWSPFAVVAAVHALAHEFGWTKTVEAFRSVRISLNQRLADTGRGFAGIAPEQ